MIELSFQVNQIKFHVYKLPVSFYFTNIMSIPRNLYLIERASLSIVFVPSKNEFYDSEMGQWAFQWV